MTKLIVPLSITIIFFTKKRSHLTQAALA